MRRIIPETEDWLRKSILNKIIRMSKDAVKEDALGILIKKEFKYKDFIIKIEVQTTKIRGDKK